MEYLNVVSLAELLKMPTPTIYSKLQRGKTHELPAFEVIAGRYVWKMQDVQNWLAANKVTAKLASNDKPVFEGDVTRRFVVQKVTA